MAATIARAQEVDETLARIWGERAAALQDIDGTLVSLHYIDGQRSSYRGRTKVWPLTDRDTEASVMAKLADTSSSFWATSPGYNDDQPFLIHTGKDARGALSRLDAARSRVDALAEEAGPLTAEYAADPWPRFFLVQNHGGHIHSSMDCVTTFPTTQWAWLPSLSGRDEETAVAEQGPRLCSVCYPSAPVEWTLGMPKAPRCPGSNLPPAPGRERYASQPCSVCGRSYPVSNNTGVVRAHKPQEA